jgi:hypothetical protein
MILLLLLTCLSRNVKFTSANQAKSWVHCLSLAGYNVFYLWKLQLQAGTVKFPRRNFTGNFTSKSLTVPMDIKSSSILIRKLFCDAAHTKLNASKRLLEQEYRVSLLLLVTRQKLIYICKIMMVENRWGITKQCRRHLKILSFHSYHLSTVVTTCTTRFNITKCYVFLASWPIITGSGSDDGIYWRIILQSLSITINSSAIANLPTSQITRTR